MYHLATVFPKLKDKQLPFSRDQLVLLIAAINELILGIDILLAHSISGTIVPLEWIPIIFGISAGLVLLAAGALALRRRTLATLLASIVFLGSILVGVLGSYFHLRRGLLPSAAFGQQITLNLLVWAPPIFGPISFAGVGLLGISAAWIESPADSGILKLLRGRKIRLPLSKTRAYFLLVSLGILSALISSAFDHARTGFENPWLWLPTAAGVFATVVPAIVGATEKPSKNDIIVYITAMVILLIVGLIGTGLHVITDLTSDFEIVPERFLRGAPLLAPLQYANMAMLGLIVLLNPEEERK